MYIPLILLVLNTLYFRCNAETYCPNEEAVKPCVCNEGNITCAGDTRYDLKSIFKAISVPLNDTQKHFNEFLLSNTAISELEEDVFGDISFEVIRLEYAHNLTRISSNAFTASNKYLKGFKTRDTPIDNNYGEYNVFSALSSMQILDYIEIQNSKITAINSNEFKPAIGALSNLRYLGIFGNPSNGSLRDIGSYAFAQLINLQILYLGHNQINFIPGHAFQFDQKSDRVIKIYLEVNKLNTSSFALEAFSSVNRPFDLYLGNNYDLKYLKESVFAPVLSNGNHVDLYDIRLECDCKMYWLLTQNNAYINSVLRAKCSDGQSVFNASNDAYKTC